eukprot:scaffold35214_cov129-Isochrysis_galbana.AAC.5
MADEEQACNAKLELKYDSLQFTQAKQEPRNRSNNKTDPKTERAPIIQVPRATRSNSKPTPKSREEAAPETLRPLRPCWAGDLAIRHPLPPTPPTNRMLGATRRLAAPLLSEGTIARPAGNGTGRESTTELAGV